MVLAGEPLAVLDLHHLPRQWMERIEDPYLACRTPGIVTLSRRARAKRICASPWLRRSFAPAPEGVSSTWSISSISSNRRRQPVARADYPKTCCATISSSSTNSAISRSASPAGNCCSIYQQALRKHLAADHHQSRLRRLAAGVRRRQNDHRHARPTDPPLRYRRDWQYELALQEPLLIPIPLISSSPRKRAERNFFAPRRCRPSGRLRLPSRRHLGAFSSRHGAAQTTPFLTPQGGRYWTR